MIPDWLRFIPHIGYGKCGGRNRDCSVREPVDKLDEAFREHDCALFEASLEPDEAKREEMRQEADKALAKRLRGDLGRLPLWGWVYVFFAKMVFKE